MAEVIYKTKEECIKAIETVKAMGYEPADWMLKQLEAFENAEKTDADTPIYSILKANAPFKPIDPKKLECIESTVEQLMDTGPRADEPGLLLGKIQCGKTDTFENIIGLAFDKGIDIAIVFTKGTKPLAEQTKMRMKKDYRFFKPTDDKNQKLTINIHDIMDVWKNLTPARVDGCKTVIVCKKETTNLSHLISLFSTNKHSAHFRKKKVLIVDDEADFASRNYRAVKLNPIYDEEGNPVEQERETTMAKIAQQIDDFRKLPDFCRYLQVTATPYCLYLQPQGELYLNGNKVLPFKPRFTSIVPVHDRYIGGQQYFIDSQDPESMYSHLYRQVNQKCIDVLGHEDKRYLNNSIASGNLYGMTYALISYLMGTAVRRIQRDKEGKVYQSSALIHVEIDKKNHDWQKRVIDRLLGDIDKCIVQEDNSDPRISTAVDTIYEDFRLSNEKGRKAKLFKAALPSKEDILDEIRSMFITKNIHTQVVNSDEAVVTLLDEETGELRLDHIANIFIGGNILDRGITIKNMLCFFYGRNPSSFQQDTVLQHARMYGAREKEDMAVTRLHTTDVIYKILVRMNELDNQLRQWFIDGKDQEEPNAVFVGYDKHIKPCATQKIKASNALILKAQKRIVPSGFWTGTKKEISETTEEITRIIKGCPGYAHQDENGFFEMDKDTAFEILHLVRNTYVYNSDHFNNDHKSDIPEMLCALEYCTSKSDGKLFALHREDRNMTRIRENGAFVDAPDDGRTDTAPSRSKAVDKPVLMLIKQNGNKVVDENGNNIGWNNAPFYWPVVMTQEKMDTVMFALDQKAKGRGMVNDLSDMVQGIDPNDILNLTFKGDLVEHFGEEGTDYGEEGGAEESRSIKDTTASRYIVKDENGEWLINPDIEFDEEHYQGVYSLNNEVFPFVFRPYKYMLLRDKRDGSGCVMLLELTDPKYWHAVPEFWFNEDGDLIDRDTEKVLVHGTDVITDKNMETTDYVNEHICQWIVIYRTKKVLKVKNAVNVEDFPDDEEEE